MASNANAQELGPSSAGVADSSGTHWELAGKGGFLSAPIRGGTTPFGAGFGGRLGVSFSDVYVGASVVDYLGATDVDVWSHSVLYGVETGYSIHLSERGGVSLVLRPQVGLGGMTLFRTTPIAATAATTSTRVSARAQVDVITTASGGTSSSSGSSSSGSSAATSTTDTVESLYVQPGLTMMVSGPITFAAVTADVLVLPGISYGGSAPTTWISYGLEAQLGVRF